MSRAAWSARPRLATKERFMVIVMEKNASDEAIERVVAVLSERGFDVHRSTGSDQTVLGVVGDGAYKPRTSPYAFQGMGVEGLKLLRAAGDENNMATISEVMEIGQIETMMEYVDILQVGARNMQNYNLLSALGQVRKPILLKRGMSATIQEWLLASEYILAGGNYDVILCE